MENVKAYLSHLYFSFVVVLLGMIGLYIVLYIIDLVLSPIHLSFGFRGFSVGNHLKLLGAVWVVASLGLAGVLTYSTIKNRPVDRIMHTKRMK
jgi:hypothetical protein